MTDARAQPVWTVVGDGPLPDAAIEALAALLIDVVEAEEREAEEREMGRQNDATEG